MIRLFRIPELLAAAKAADSLTVLLLTAFSADRSFAGR
jgi:hypothetical protein